MSLLYQTLAVAVFAVSLHVATGEVPEVCPPECGFGNYYDDLTDYTKFFNKSIEFATEKHRDRVNNMMDDLYSELEPSVQLSDRRIREAGQMVKEITERVLREADPETVQICLSDAQQRIEVALKGSTKYLKDCTDEMNKDSVEVMTAYDEEASEHKRRVGGAYDVLLACNKNVSSNRFLDSVGVHSQCCGFDLWNNTRGFLAEYHQFADKFFTQGTDRGKDYIVNTIACLERVGENTYRKVKFVMDDITDCAGLKRFDYID